MREHARHFVPTCMTVAPCSEPSRPSPVGGRRGLREDETRWRIGLHGACEAWRPKWPARGLTANENVCALMSMVARSTHAPTGGRIH